MDRDRKQQIKCSNIQTSISSVIGNATSFYMAWLRSKFPETFFKDTYVSGSLVSVETQRKDIFRKEKPLLLVKPEYAAENGFMEELPYWHNTLVYVFKDPDKYYTQVFNDPDHDIRIHAIPDRIKINFPTRIVVPTKVYGFNLLHYMKNIIEPGGHGFINNVYFENEIPSVFMHLIFDEIFNKDIKARNKEKQRIIDNKEDLLYNKEVKIIKNIKKIKMLNPNDIQDSITISELNKENNSLDRDTKRMKRDIDKLRNSLEPIRFLDDSDEEKRVKNRQDLEDYLNTFSNHNIVCRRNVSSGNYEYAFKNRCNILMHMDSIPTMDPVKVGRAEDYAAISFEVSFDFNTNSNFLLESNYSDITTVNEDALKDKNKYHFNLWYDESIPDFILEDEVYFTLRKKRKFICELNSGVETLPIEDLLDDATRILYNKLEAIRSTLNKKNPDNVDSLMKKHYKEIFRTRLFLNGDLFKPEDDPEGNDSKDHFHWKRKELTEGTDYEVDWEKLEVHIKGPIRDAAYLIGVYVNYYKVNSVINEIEDYKSKKLAKHNKEEYVLRSPKGIKYNLVIDKDGNIKTEFFMLNTLIDIPKWNIEADNGVIYEITVDDDGTIGTKLTDSLESKLVTMNGYKIIVNDKGKLDTTPIL